MLRLILILGGLLIMMGHTTAPKLCSTASAWNIRFLRSTSEYLSAQGFERVQLLGTQLSRDSVNYTQSSQARGYPSSTLRPH